VGIIGQVSLLNTFCHIHTPLMLSLTRDLAGLALGALIGVALFCAAEWLIGVFGTRRAGAAQESTPTNAPRSSG
jgi:hypothetical protein